MAMAGGGGHLRVGGYVSLQVACACVWGCGLVEYECAV